MVSRLQWVRPSVVLLVMMSTSLGCTGFVDRFATADGTHAEEPAVPLPINQPLQCTAAGVHPGFQPLRRLTHRQFANAVRDLFPGAVERPTLDRDLASEVVVDGFLNNAKGQAITLELMEAYHASAERAAEQATSPENLGRFAPCEGTSTTAQRECAERFVTTFGRRAFRHTLSTEETQRLLTLYEVGRAEGGYAQGIATVISGMLLAPQFLFLMEEGAQAEPGMAVVPLDSEELAARLSFFLWDTLPDDALIAAAEAGQLETPEQIAAQVERMLEDERAKNVITNFHREWLNAAELDRITKDPSEFPFFSEATTASMRTSLERFTDRHFWEGGSLADLLTDSRAYVDEALAPIYGVDAPSGSGMSLVDLGEHRAGILTQAGLLATLAKPLFDSPVHRGLFVLERLLCERIGDPPDNVGQLEDPEPGAPPTTTRQRLEASHSNPVCAGCHDQIDGIGFGFGHYDAVGRYRDLDHGVPVDATGEFVNTMDIDGPFDGTVDMAHKLASSRQVQQCVAAQWFRFAFGRTETADDECALAPIADAFVASDGDLRTLVVALTTSDAFRYRSLY